MKIFDKKLYQKCKKELKKSSEFLNYYSPTLTVLKQFLKDFKNKNILEIGYRDAVFLNYLKKKEVNVYGIDIKPEKTNKNLLKMSVENVSKKFLKKYDNKFHAIFERITLSKLYDKNYFLKNGKHRFKNKEKILSNIYKLLKNKGILILQDDRGTVFTELQFKKIGFKKLIKETPIIFKDKKGKNLGWNILVVYQKTSLMK